MANNNRFSFPGTAYYTEGPIFSNNIFASTEDNLADASMSYNIDPVLQSPLPSDLYLEQWSVAQEQQLLVQRFLEDNQTKAFFNADVPSRLIPNRAAAAHNMRPAVGIPPVPPPSHVRFASPVSSPGPSSSSDNMHSPPTDTDSHYEPFGSPAPLFQQPASFDPHWATTHEVQFVGMGPGDTCVNPHDINPSSQPMDCYENESSNLDLSFPQRGYSFESYTSSTSQCDMEPANNTSSNTVAVLDLPVRRLSSPDAIEPVVKDEIRASTHFPPPPTSTPEAETEMSDAEPLPPSLKRKKSDSLDDAYTPPNKKPNLNTRRQPRRGNATTTAQKPQPQQAPQSPPQKKTKTSHPTQSVPPAAASPPPPPSSSTANMKALPPSSTSGRPGHACPDCTQSFKDQTLLDNHIKKQHTRPFICVFHFAGCPSTFASKNEWKRHVASQHLLLNYWLCDEGSCGASSAAGNKPSTNGPPSAMHGGNGGTKARNGGGRLARNQNSGGATTLDLGDSAANNTNNGGGGVIFNRKDLYTQHVRRMHMPPQIKKSLKQQQQQQQQAASSSSSCTSTASSSSTSKKPSTPTPENSTATTTNPSAILLSTEWDTRLRGFQARAIRERCKLPLMMTCPAAHCDMVFHGEDSWDQRMEHVARHLEKAAQGREPPVRFGNSGGGEEDSADDDDDDVDRCLVEWASRADVDIIRRKRKNKNGGGGWEWELNPLLKRGSAAQSCATATAAAGGSQGIVLLQSNSSAASGSGRRKNTRPAAAVRFAPVKDEEDEEEEVVIKNEIVVTSSDDDDEEEEEEKEIVVYEDDDGLRDAEGEEEDDE